MFLQQYIFAKAVIRQRIRDSMTTFGCDFFFKLVVSISRRQASSSDGCLDLLLLLYLYLNLLNEEVDIPCSATSLHHYCHLSLFFHCLLYHRNGTQQDREGPGKSISCKSSKQEIHSDEFQDQHFISL